MNPEGTEQIVGILEKTISADKSQLEAAQLFLEHAAQTNLIEFMKTLSDILHNGANSIVARMAAGLQLKNKLTSKDEAIKATYQQRWLAIPEDARTYIKNNILDTLGSETNRPSASAQCVAYVAVVELPTGQWPDLIAKLVANVVGPSSTEMMKEATLESIGYICSEIDHEVLVTQANEILTAIIHGMRPSEPSLHVRLAATNALHNSLEFTRANFDRESERNFIMEVVCEATQCSDTQIRVAALQCLVKIMSLYYHYMEPYMGQALFPITLEAMKSDVDEIALQGIEFWSNVSDEEVDLAIEESEAGESGQPPTRSSKFYAKGALQYLIPVLMTKLTKQEEMDDEDDWNPSKAAGVCLMLLSSCCEDDIVPHVLPFVKENIKSPDWRYRDAAIMAFGAILSGLEATTLKPLVEQAMPTLIELMYDQSVVVRDTAAWTFGRICEIVPDAAINETYLKPLLEAFVNALKQEPRVAANVCWAFGGLAEAAYEQAAENVPDGGQPETYCLSSCFQFIVQRLLETTDRTDGAQANLRSAAYEALMEMVKNSPKDCYMFVQQTTMVILERLNQVLQMEGHIQTNSDRAQYHDLQGHLCATLQSVLRKVTPQDAPQISDPIMGALLQMFSSDSGKSGGVQEDALMAVSTLVEVLGEGFIKYMDSFKPFLFIGLKNHAEYQVCIAAVGLVGDICRAIKRKVLEYSDEIMMVLLENLGDQSVHRSVKPHIFSVFGDIGLSIGPDFKKYLEVVLQTLYQASLCEADHSDYEMLDYINELREAVVGTYSAVIQGLKGSGPVPAPDVQILEPHLHSICAFLNKVAEDSDRADGVTATAAGLVGDLCSTFGALLLPMLDTEAVQKMLIVGRKTGTQRTKTLSSWAAKEIRKIKNSQAPPSWAATKCRKVVKTNVPTDGMDLDDLLPQVGEFGRYQKILLLLVCLPACIPCGFCAFNQLFMADVPPHWCRVTALENFTVEERKLLAIPKDAGVNESYSSCTRYSVDWSETLSRIPAEELMANESWPTEECKEGWEFDPSYPVSIVVDFDLVCERDIYPTIGLAALNVGGPVGVYSFGILNDRIGRKKSYFCCLTIVIAGGILTAFAQDFWSWAGYRLIVGLTVPAAYQIPFIISLELVGPNYRSFVTVLTCLFYTLGLVLLAVVTYFIRDWRTLALSTSAPFLLYYFYWFVLPESPRWLLAKGKLEAANAILEKLAATNGKDLPDTFKQRLKQRMMLHRTKSEEQRLQEGPGAMALWKTPNMRMKTALITLNWFASEMVYVGLSYYGPALGSEEHMSFLLSCLVEIPSYFCCLAVMDRWGRRWPLCLSMVLSGLSCVLTVLVPPGEEMLTMILYLFSKFTISASFLIIYPFAGELYPTQLRGVGIGTSAYIGGIGLIIIPFVTYLGRDNLELPLVIMGTVSVLGGLTALRLPETLHQRLPQTVEEGEEFGKDFGWTDCLRCIPLRPSSRASSYEDLNKQEAPAPQKPTECTVEDEEASELSELRPRSRPPLIRRASKLVRQTSLMETNLDATGSMQMTYWF